MFKSMENWLFGYLASIFRRPKRHGGLRHLIVSVCDHFEPYRGGADKEDARRIVREWTEAYPDAVAGFRDADGCPPRHTFFYPQEEYDAEILDALAAFCQKGFGEVEIHLHHRHDTPDGLRDKLVKFRDLLHERHGLLGVERETADKRPEAIGQCEAQVAANGSTSDAKADIPAAAGRREGEYVRRDVERHPGDEASAGKANVYGLEARITFSRIRYGFIHGNWSLCNSRPDGDWCGVNEELGLLSETGCFADFTFPSAPSSTQPRIVNAIYYARDKPGKPRGADRGERLSVIRHRFSGKPSHHQQRNAAAGALMLITGPLALNWKRRKWGIFPRLENSEISGGNPPTIDRVRLWVKQSIGVAGRPDWVFVKLHTHGCMPENAKVLLGEKMRGMHAALQREYNDGVRWQLHYVTAREMYNLVKAAEAGRPGSPGLWRDWLVRRPPALTRGNRQGADTGCEIRDTGCGIE